MSLDRVPHPVDACYPAESQEVLTRLRHAALFRDVVNLRERPVASGETVIEAPSFRVEARPLSHSVPTVGYRLMEPDGRRMLPDKLAAFGVTGPDVGRLQRQGSLAVDGRLVRLPQVSEPRRGQRFAFIMDTAV
jgi:ribonuclease Z